MARDDRTPGPADPRSRVLTYLSGGRPAFGIDVVPATDLAVDTAVPLIVDAAVEVNVAVVAVVVVVADAAVASNRLRYSQISQWLMLQEGGKSVLFYSYEVAGSERVVLLLGTNGTNEMMPLVLLVANVFEASSVERRDVLCALVEATEISERSTARRPFAD